MDKLPDNPKSIEEKLGLIESMKKIAKDLDRAQVEAQVLQLKEDVISRKTLALCYVLAGVISNSTSLANSNSNWKFLKHFLECCNESEIRFCDEPLESICRYYADSVSTAGLKASLQACGPLFIALKKRTSGAFNELTTIHTDFMQVCLVAKMYSFAVQVADAGAISVCLRKDKSSLSSNLPLDLQRYFYYVGIAYCGMLRFKEATHSFLECLSLPSKSFGAVHQDAYKKFVLTSLISHGKLIPLPRYVVAAVSKTIEQDRAKNFEIYRKIATGFEKIDQGVELQGVLNDPPVKAELICSGNFGLSQQVSEAYLKTRVIKLTGTYVTLGFDEISRACGIKLERIEPELIGMIQEKQIHAKLDQKTCTVHFLSEAEDPDEQSKAAIRLETEIAQVKAVASDLRSLDTHLSTSKVYINRLAFRNGAGSGSGGDVSMLEG